MDAIVIATKNAKCLPVLLASIEQYVPNHVITFISGSHAHTQKLRSVNTPNDGKSFGESYNAIVSKAFETFDEIIVANDDVVLTPTTYQKLNEDIDYLTSRGHKLGWLAARSDYVRPSQIAHTLDPNLIYRAVAVAPLFAYISRDAWIDYAPINWYSDDIQCMDMTAKGYENFVSRAYVHHVGSQTIGLDNMKNSEEPREWIQANRPDMYERIYEAV